jgi:1-aminocyclopropane-1-carboxylate deaminase/D-cysteine desulfhydrase-like pyridoxal-dependent ACC family enzyme
LTKAIKLSKLVSKIPRARLVYHQSPVESWSRLREKWNLDFELSVKRDDLIGPAFGGNKSRQLEFLLGDAINKGSDVIVHGGAIQSNYCRQLAAAASMVGLKCHLLLSNHYSQQYDQGNHLLDQIFGAEIDYFDGRLGTEHEAAKAKLTEKLAHQGFNPYLITYPQSEVLGGMGYLIAALELVDQLDESNFPERIVMPAVGASYAGLLLGFELLGKSHTEVLGFAPLSKEYDIVEGVKGSITGICNLLSIPLPQNLFDRIDISFDYVGPGYAKVSKYNLRTIVEVARAEGVLLDPVYTSKAAAALQGLTGDGKKTLFWHTGGTPSIFAYSQEILEFLGSGS